MKFLEIPCGHDIRQYAVSFVGRVKLDTHNTNLFPGDMFIVTSEQFILAYVGINDVDSMPAYLECNVPYFVLSSSSSMMHIMDIDGDIKSFRLEK